MSAQMQNSDSKYGDEKLASVVCAVWIIFRCFASPKVSKCCVHSMTEDMAELVGRERISRVVVVSVEQDNSTPPLEAVVARAADSDDEEDAVDDNVEPSVNLLSRSDSEEVSGTMIEAADFRALSEGPAYASLNGRLSPGFSTASSYATLTPLQPLPPISTMSDKFSHYAHHGNVTGNFTLMQNNMGLNFQYDKLGTMSVMNMSPTLGVTHASAVSMLAANGLSSQSIPSPPYSQNGIHTPEKSLSPTGFESYSHRDLGSPQSPALHTPTSMMQTLNGLNVPSSPPPPAQIQEPSPPSKPSPGPMTVPVVSLAPSAALNVALSLASAIPVPVHVTVQPAVAISSTTPQGQQQVVVATPVVQQQPQQQPQPQQQQQQQQQQAQPQTQQQPQVITTIPNKTVLVATAVSPSSAKSSGDEVEEINTKELAQRISAELKRYSIPQAIFAQRVLCRSQGTLSDLLRNPKPWSKLKSGRETFRRMYKWLEEPEFQRMSALRLAEGGSFSRMLLDRQPTSSSSCPSTSTDATTVSINTDINRSIFRCNTEPEMGIRHSE
ncbi:one cut domain family member 2 isoform X2 [Parasteatoda tepidariorum]|nr:one cut domain family member 2 isoform X2 [Parasteatoda tepidariorum]